jgi:hypothetical protein
LSEWCVQRWAEKEKFLAQFYKDKKFPNTIPADQVPSTTLTFLFTMLLWVSSIGATFYMLYQFSAVRWYLLFVTIFHVVASAVFGGVDTIEKNWMKNRSNKQA